MTGAQPALQARYWAADRYQKVANRLSPLSVALCDRAALRAEENVLDVATATGNAALTAAERHCKVTAIDTDLHMLGVAQRRALDKNLQLTLRNYDAQNMPFPADLFDAVISAGGVQFAPDPAACAAELLRVCRPTGRIVVGSWGPASPITIMFEILHAVCPLVNSILACSTEWGTAKGLHRLFEGKATVEAEESFVHVEVPSVEEWADILCENFGPARLAIAESDAPTAAEIHQSLRTLFAQCTDGEAPSGNARLRMECLQAVVIPLTA
ncbi:class I SAM-dependent methyltransferase [Streptomyces sp. NPDC090022]|uniref:class I SAM-dependent methyltransferase n=1 Tax=Streptomyces sp. NPDC090022 TaxID=3365920 RepID=UPI00382802D3